jgi:trimethylamine--corrinoid protein Co-methyltransferase
MGDQIRTIKGGENMEAKIKILTEKEIDRIHLGSIEILEKIGMKIDHPLILNSLQEAGAIVDKKNSIVRFPESLVMDSLGKVPRSYTVYGRDFEKRAHFGHHEMVITSSMGEPLFVDTRRNSQHPPTTEDFKKCMILGDALENINIVGALAVPSDIPTLFRDVYQIAELIKYTRKPNWAWITNGKVARYVLEIYKTVAGGGKELTRRPLIQTLVEPVSPLQLIRSSAEILIEFTRLGLPVGICPMAMASATAPATLAGTIVQENAEILAVVVIVQVLHPGTPVLYGAWPHIMDQKVGLISFGSPEDGLMYAAMTQIGKSYGLPVLVNSGLTDSKLVDAQAGLEKGMTFLLGALAGANSFCHMGICGADQGASLTQLVVDDEMIGYCKRMLKKFTITEETLAVEAIRRVGVGGNFLADDHTIAHFRKELWFPDMWDRQKFDSWYNSGAKSMSDRAFEKQQRILTDHHPGPIEEKLGKEIDKILSSARKDLLGE